MAALLHKKKQFTSSQIILIGFALVILLGALLLMLPVSSRSGEPTAFIDALFTSTSATCVTGLIVHDTGTYWSAFGQAVILCLIQAGGMGVITVSIVVAMISGKKISLMQRSTLQEAISAPKVGGIVRLTRFIIKGALIVELLGAMVMAPVFCADFGVSKGIWMSLFHSVSAFCNAGFDLMGQREAFSSLTSYADQPVINITICLLIVIGGIGFLTWDDIRTNRWHLRRYRMQSKVILTVSAILIFVPAVYFYFCEFADMTMGSRTYMSLFQSVTVRTAGFNTADLRSLSGVGQGIMILLMLIGGSPGSTAGGMKTTTVAVLVATSVSVFRKREHAHLFKRRISDDVVKTAVAVLLMYVVLFLGGGFIISGIEGLPLADCLFETASAVGTVGLTLSITPGLSAPSHLILTALMFFGRVGGLTLIFAALSDYKKSISEFPQEKITVG